MTREQEIYEAAGKAILDFNVDKAKEVAEEGVNLGIDPMLLIESGFLPAINKIGDDFDKGLVYLPELMLASDAMKAAAAVCESALPTGTSAVKKKVVMGTVAGDIHDIGKSIVCAVLTANGFEVYDIGRDMPVERFVEKAREVGADVVGASALLTTTMDEQKKVVEAIKSVGLNGVKTIIGGAPVSQEWADSIGADGYAENAIGAVAIIRKLTNSL